MPKRRGLIYKFFIILILFIAVAAGYYVFKKRPEKNIRKILYRDYINIISYNINHAIGTDGNYSISRIIRALRRKPSDLIFLFDVDYKLGRTFYDDQARIIAANLGMEFTFGKLIEHDGGWNGFAILTRYPIEFSELQVNKEGNNITYGILHATTKIGDKKIHSYGIYFLGDSSSFHDDFKKIIDLIMKRGINNYIVASTCFKNPPDDKIMSDMSYYLYEMSSARIDAESVDYVNDLVNIMNFIYINDYFEPVEFLIMNEDIAQEASDYSPIWAKVKMKIE